MKTTLSTIAMTIGLTAVLGTATLFAQTASKANIPFDFQITGQTMPAGQYSVKLANSSRMLTFRNVATGLTTVVLAQPSETGTMEEGKLIFLHSGERYMLQSAWFAGVRNGYGVPQGKRDRADGERGIVATVRLLQK